MECVPIVNAEVEKLTVPEVVTCMVASVIAPSLNEIFPVGVPAPGLSTESEAVNVTLCAKLTLTKDDVSATVVAAWLTVSGTAADELAAKVASPL